MTRDHLSGSVEHEADRLKLWCAWLDRLWGSVFDLLLSRRGLKECAKVLIRGQASLLALQTLGISYQSWVALKIRCQLDTDKRSVSLARLLNEIAPHPDLLTRDRFVRRYVSNRHVNAPFKTTHWSVEEQKQFMLWSREGNRRFDEIVGVGVRSLSAEMISRDQSSLRECAEMVRNFVNKQVAHHDEIGLKARPVNGSLDAWLDHLGVNPCIELIRSLFVKYWWLINVSELPDLPEVSQATS
ncbi:hypothetical protein IMX07_11855 [bacterium]|nr:hypothetical protein [bacterium]